LPGIHRVSFRSDNPKTVRSRRSRSTIYAAAGSLIAASAAATALVLIPADASKPLPTAADTGRLSTAGDLTRASYHAAAGPTAREVHQLLARTQAADRARIARREEAAQRRQAQRQQAQRQQAAQHQTSPSNSASAPAAASGSPQQIAKSMLAQFGWSSSQFSCLDPLWERESGWNPYAANPSSGAYGIPQALPGAKMASAGADWATNAATQIRWGLGYIKATYGSPCAAWSHETTAGWY
jgi:hypothetical protein